MSRFIAIIPECEHPWEDEARADIIIRPSEDGDKWDVLKHRTSRTDSGLNDSQVLDLIRDHLQIISRP
jgi:hypothetical protein